MQALSTLFASANPSHKAAVASSDPMGTLSLYTDFFSRSSYCFNPSGCVFLIDSKVCSFLYVFKPNYFGLKSIIFLVGFDSDVRFTKKALELAILFDLLGITLLFIWHFVAPICDPFYYFYSCQCEM